MDLEKQNQDLKEQVRLKEIDSNLYHAIYKAVAEKDKVIADLQAKLKTSTKDEKSPTSATITTTDLRGTLCKTNEKSVQSQEFILHCPNIDVTDEKVSEISEPPSSMQSSSSTLLPSTTQAPNHQRDQSPEIPEPMIVVDSESDDSDGQSDVQFAPNQIKLSYQEKAKRKKQAKAKERAKMMMDSALKRQEPWKCGICSSFFRTDVLLREHILMHHKERKHLCKRCPYSTHGPADLKKHENPHAINDVKFKKAPEGRECTLCHVWFGTNGHLVGHLRQFHLPKPSQ